MKIAVCDDEKTIRELMEAYLIEYFETRKISGEVGLYAAGEPFVKHNKSYDLVFLDYKLPDGNGLDFAKRIRQENDKIFIVFATSFEEYASDGYTVSAFRYLVKPLRKEDLFEAMDVFTRLYQTDRKIAVNGLDKTIYVDADEGMYIEAQKKYPLVHTTSKNITSYKSISEYEAEIKNTHFFRVQRSFIVNMKYISAISKKTITLSCGEELSIGKNYYDAFLQSYMGYLKYKN